MPKREEEEVTRIHVHLYLRDVERLDLMFGGSMGRARSIRKIVRAFLNNVEAKVSERAVHVAPEFNLSGDDNDEREPTE